MTLQPVVGQVFDLEPVLVEQFVGLFDGKRVAPVTQSELISGVWSVFAV